MKRFCLITALLACSLLTAQDIHWSQPVNAMLYQNPAFAGVNGAFGFGIQYRNQWNAVNTSYHTGMISGDYRIVAGKSWFGIGAVIYNDLAGDGNYRTTSGGITASCLLPTGKNSRLGAGLGINGVQNSLKPDRLSWGSQFNGQEYNPALVSGESDAQLSKFNSDLNAGICFAFDESMSTNTGVANNKFAMGYSLNHLNRADIALSGGHDKLAFKHVLFAHGHFFIKDNVALKPVLLAYKQASLFELTFGSLLRFQVGQISRITGIKKGSSFAFGLLYRFNDAIIPAFEMEKGNLLFGISYDMNVSKLSKASRLRGGIELSVRVTNFSDYLYKNKTKVN